MNEKYIEWLKATENDEKAHSELVGIKNDEEEINDRFYCELKFGTGGLCGKLGINGLPKSNVLSFTGKNIKVTVRPSGTEPKLKIYYQVKANGETSADKLLLQVSEIAEKRFCRISIIS